jgi:hypothetical protein
LPVFIPDAHHGTLETVLPVLPLALEDHVPDIIQA